MSEHDWEELYVLRPSRAVYTGLDKCSKCDSLRRLFARAPAVYKSADWGYNTTEEPPCKEEED